MDKHLWFVYNGGKEPYEQSPKPDRTMEESPHRHRNLLRALGRGAAAPQPAQRRFGVQRVGGSTAWVGCVTWWSGDFTAGLQIS